MSSVINEIPWKGYFNAKIVQKAVIIDEEENILVIKRTSIGEFNGRKDKWDFPGGNIDDSDLLDINSINPHIIALYREIEEETGLIVNNSHEIFMRSNIRVRDVGNILSLAIGYLVRIEGIKPKITLSDEHIEFNWLTKEEIPNLDFGDTQEFFVKCIEAL